MRYQFFIGEQRQEHNLETNDLNPLGRSVDSWTSQIE